MFTDARATDVATHACLIDWKSSRSGRLCRSTLAAEASAADTSVDRSSFCNLMLSEILQEGDLIQNHHTTAHDSGT